MQYICISYMCIVHVSATHVIHLYFYTCTTPKDTTYVLQVYHSWPSKDNTVCDKYFLSD